MLIRWQGGADEELRVPLARPCHQRWKHSSQLVARVRELSKELSEAAIAQKLNEEGLRTNKGNAFSVSVISWIRYKHRIAGPFARRAGEETIREVGTRLGVSDHVVRYWLNQGLISYRRAGRRYWLQLSEEQEAHLRTWVQHSKRIAKVRMSESQQQIEGSVL